MATRPGMFSTHKGKNVMRALWFALALSITFTMTSNMANSKNSSASASSPPSAGMGVQVKAAPRVAFAPANPYKAASNTVVDVPSAGDTAASKTYQDMLAVAQQAALPFGTYSYSQKPEEYVESIPGMTPEMKSALLTDVQRNWGVLVADATSVKADGMVSITPAAYDISQTGNMGQRQGSGQVSVILHQVITGRSGKTQERTSPVMVWLKLTPGSNLADEGTWNVVGLSR